MKLLVRSQLAKILQEMVWLGQPQPLKPIMKVARMLKTHLENILTYLRHATVL